MMYSLYVKHRETMISQMSLIPTSSHLTNAVRFGNELIIAELDKCAKTNKNTARDWKFEVISFLLVPVIR